MHGSRTQSGQERSNAWAQRSSFVPADGPGINKDAKGQIPFDKKSPIQVVTLNIACGLNATLLVMGGYGHSRLREFVFGGFTQRVLDAADLPVLMAH